MQQLIDFNVEEFVCEENFGGRAWAKVLKGKYEVKGGKKCKFRTFSQDRNKEAKILSRASTVNRKIYMPKSWGQKWPKFYTHVTEFQRAGKNAFDDGPDMLSEISMRLKKGGIVTI